MAGITINPTFDALYTMEDKSWGDTRTAASADSIDTRSTDYTISLSGSFIISRVYIEFDLSSVTVAISTIDFYLYANTKDSGNISIAYCGQLNLNQDVSDYSLYINNSAPSFYNSSYVTGLNKFTLDLKSFNYDSKNGTSVVFVILASNDYLNQQSTNRSINIDSNSGTNTPYLIINDTPVSGWSQNIKSISYSNISVINGVGISDIISVNGVS